VLGTIRIRVFLFSVFLLVLGCQTTPPPIEDYSLARAAIEAARSVQAQRHSPGHWAKADELYRRARILYRERENEEARKLFIEARVAAEKAENAARLLRQKNGEIL